jgi:histone-lysine N-methyltransferase SETD3
MNAVDQADASSALVDAALVDGSAGSSASVAIPSLAEELSDASLLSSSTLSAPAPAPELVPPPAPVFKFQIVTDWLRAGGATFDNLYIPENESDRERANESENEPASSADRAAAPASSASTSAISGVYLRSSVAPGVPLLRVPLSHIMTSETAFASEIGQAIIRAEQRGGLMLRSKHSFLAAFLLVERVKGEASFWWPYIQCLPTAYDHVPIHFADADLALLQGSMVLAKIADRRDSLRAEFVELQRHVGGTDHFGRFTLEEFVWARNVVVTRIFGMVVGGRKTDGLVPMADLLNHRRPRETKWTFDDAAGAFTVTSLRALQGGCQVHDSYGRKCNSRFFVNYGFALEENADNEARFVFGIAPSDPFFDLRLRLLGGSSGGSNQNGGNSNHALSQREFSLVGTYSSKDAHVREAFSFLRFAFARAAEVSVLAAAKDFRIADVAPISVVNELRVLEQVRACAAQSLDEFDASVEQDDFILAHDAALTRAQRSCVIMRRGEKLVRVHARGYSGRLTMVLHALVQMQLVLC